MGSWQRGGLGFVAQFPSQRIEGRKKKKKKPFSRIKTSGSDGKASTYNAEDPGSIPVREDPLQKEMSPHCSTLAWKIPWTEEPGSLQAMGLQRVGHD